MSDERTLYQTQMGVIETSIKATTNLCEEAGAGAAMQHAATQVAAALASVAVLQEFCDPSDVPEEPKYVRAAADGVFEALQQSRLRLTEAAQWLDSAGGMRAQLTSKPPPRKEPDADPEPE